jgi:hypothetical protein
VIDLQCNQKNTNDEKKLCLLLMIVSGAIYSQVGINTSNPQGTFHVDGGKDNDATG